jgi:8-amino-7-oxononanoate synthase
MDLFDKTKGLGIVYTLREAQLYPFFRILDESVGNNVVSGGKTLVMMSSNNYLGLTHDPRVIDASVAAIKYWGTGCTGSRFLNGNLSIHEELEKKIAEFFDAEAAIVFASGFLANQGAITAIVDENDHIFSDEENHACIIEGCKLANGKTHVYKHSDMEHLEKLLQSVPLEAGKLIITDGVFSMTGHLAKYDQIYALAKKYNARTYIDDAHGLGVVGEGGRGTASHFNLPADIIMGTFSKSFASQGGFVVGSLELIEWLRHKARTFMFSAALAPSSTAAAMKALDILKAEPQLITKAAENAAYFKKGIDQLSLNTLGTETTIIPVLIGDDAVTLGVCQTLLKLGIFTTPVVYPAVAKGSALIRCSVMPTHTKADLDLAIAAFAKVAPSILAAKNNTETRTLHDELGSSLPIRKVETTSHTISP